ncbi:uncharacterized protein PV09_01248 [Verruconis gallopava]|uniref:Uncharacterized protein n=1 Tax=Verruconis gallopava TaxID=253628 RepID=A0A0D1XZU3_9PEZI|nr:uncharacterized protein PV09_01248 [Verruconis gallopava]KIW08331.1 hypothetical protein PV09_01248 [Verruconis gallopava]
MSSEQLLQRVNAKFTAPASRENPDCLFVHIPLSIMNAIDIDKTLFLRIFDDMRLDPLMLRFLGKWDPGSCLSSSDGINSCYYMSYMRMRGHSVLWAYSKSSRRIRGILLPRTFNPRLNTIFNPSFKFLDAFMRNLWIHRSLITEPHGLMYICCSSIVERISVGLSHAYDAIARVEQGTGHSTWNIDHPLTLEGMTDSSKEMGRTKHRILIMKRHADCVNVAHQIVHAALQVDHAKSPVENVFSLLMTDLEALKLENENLLDRAHNQIFVLSNLIAREEARAGFQIAQAAKSDSGAMKTVAVMTMLFLPATFFAALFSLPMLQWSQTPVVQDKFWIYWAFTIPCTVIIMLFWTIITYRSSIGGCIQNHVTHTSRRRQKTGFRLDGSTTEDIQKKP